MRRNKLLWAFAALLCLLFVGAGCSDLGAPLHLLPRVQLSVTTLDFGTVAVTGANTLTVSVGNTGEADLQGVASLTCPDFSLESGGGAYTVTPGGQHDVVVRYSPVGVGPASCQLLLGDGLPVVSLSGTGTAAPVGLCVPSVSSLDFGKVDVGSHTLAGITLYSRGPVPVDVDVATSCAELTVVSGGGPRRLVPGDSLLVSLQFAPTASGLHSCSVTTGAGNPVVSTTGNVFTSFALDVAPIFGTYRCGNCHVAWTRTNQLVNVTSSYGTEVLIAPGDITVSVLYQKVANTHRFGGTMPPGTTGIASADLLRMRRWITEGARDN